MNSLHNFVHILLDKASLSGDISKEMPGIAKNAIATINQLYFEKDKEEKKR
jgi:hypothetical protein